MAKFKERIFELFINDMIMHHSVAVTWIKPAKIAKYLA